MCQPDPHTGWLDLSTMTKPCLRLLCINIIDCGTQLVWLTLGIMLGWQLRQPGHSGCYAGKWENHQSAMQATQQIEREDCESRVLTSYWRSVLLKFITLFNKRDSDREPCKNDVTRINGNSRQCTEQGQIMVRRTLKRFCVLDFC